MGIYFYMKVSLRTFGGTLKRTVEILKKFLIKNLGKYVSIY